MALTQPRGIIVQIMDLPKKTTRFFGARLSETLKGLVLEVDFAIDRGYPEEEHGFDPVKIIQAIGLQKPEEVVWAASQLVRKMRPGLLTRPSKGGPPPRPTTEWSIFSVPSGMCRTLLHHS